MKAHVRLGWLGIVLTAMVGSLEAQEMPPREARVTEMFNEVTYREARAELERPAKVGDTVRGRDVVRTGDRSLAELEFDNRSVTRLGSRSIFTFEPETRAFHVRQGISLISVPRGTGGGQIVTAAITAAIEGTTVIAEHFLVDGRRPGDPLRPAAKFIFLEGRGTVMTPDGRQQRRLRAGQMILHALGDPLLAEPQEIDLDTLFKGTGLLQRFGRPVPGQQAIEQERDRQQRELRRGLLEEGRFFLIGRGPRMGQRDPMLPVDVPVAVHDGAARDSGAMSSLSEQAPCPQCR
ncbi:MAG: hypothetical protein NZ483_01345 [Verrucomicrobiae bacterium]|nr:hypothetical protein [Verrucomicrobiae bacterium]